MRTRYVFASETGIFLANGLKMPVEWAPSEMATRTLLGHILDGVFTACNNQGHQCTASCGKPVQMLIGPFGNQDISKNITFRNSVSVEVIDVIDDFEFLLDACLGCTQGLTRIRSIAIRFVPCAKVLEIIGAAIYLE